jgi:hypothetical protein
MADLMMFDGERNDRAEFRVARDGSSSLGFYDQKGRLERLLLAAME